MRTIAQYHYLLLSILLLASCVGNQEGRKIESCLKGSISSVNPASVTFTLENITNDYLAILIQNTAFDVGSDGVLNNDAFYVSSKNSIQQTYKGRLTQYAVVTKAATIGLDPQTSRSITINLPLSYDVKDEAVDVELASNIIKVMRFKSQKQRDTWQDKVSKLDEFRLSVQISVEPIRIFRKKAP